jgi:hypothetical protein
MPLPSVAPAPIVTAHAGLCRDLLEPRGQFRHVQHDLTGLIVLDHTSLANLTRCVLESADKTKLSRFFSAAPWFPEQVNDRRLPSLLQQTQTGRGPKAAALLIRDAPVCEPGGSLCDEVDRHDPHGDDTYPLAPTPVPSPYGRGPVRFPVARRLSRRSEALPPWEACGRTPLPARPIPTHKQARARLHKDVDPVLRHAPDCAKWHQQLRTTIALGIAC